MNEIFSCTADPFLSNGAIPFRAVAAAKTDNQSTSTLSGDGHPGEPTKENTNDPADTANERVPLSADEWRERIAQTNAWAVQELLAGTTLINEINKNSQRSLSPGDCCVLVRSGKEAAVIRGSIISAQYSGYPVRAHQRFLPPPPALLYGIGCKPCCNPKTSTLCVPGSTGPLGGVPLKDITNDHLTNNARQALAEMRNSWIRSGIPAAVGALLRTKLSCTADNTDTNFTETDGIKVDSTQTNIIDNNKSIGEIILSQNDGERLWTDLHHVAELLHQAQQELQLSPTACLSWLARRHEESGDNDAHADSHSIRLESDLAAVQIVTMHASKGLEYQSSFARSSVITHKTMAPTPSTILISRMFVCGQRTEHKRMKKNTN